MEEFGNKVSKDWNKLFAIFEKAKSNIVVFGFSESYETLRDNIKIDNFNDSGDICITSPNGGYVLVALSMLISHCMEFDIAFIDPEPETCKTVLFDERKIVYKEDK